MKILIIKSYLQIANFFLLFGYHFQFNKLINKLIIFYSYLYHKPLHNIKSMDIWYSWNVHLFENLVSNFYRPNYKSIEKLFLTKFAGKCAYHHIFAVSKNYQQGHLNFFGKL